MHAEAVNRHAERIGRWAVERPRIKRLVEFLRTANQYRVMQLSGVIVVASLWLSLAFGDPSFLILLLCTAPAVWWYRRADHTPPPDEDW